MLILIVIAFLTAILGMFSFTRLSWIRRNFQPTDFVELTLDQIKRTRLAFRYLVTFSLINITLLLIALAEGSRKNHSIIWNIGTLILIITYAWIFLSNFCPSKKGWKILVALIAFALALTYLYHPNGLIMHNLATVVVLSGMGVTWGIILIEDPRTFVGVFTFLFLFDIWAVWCSTFMEKLAKLVPNLPTNFYNPPAMIGGGDVIAIIAIGIFAWYYLSPKIALKAILWGFAPMPIISVIALTDLPLPKAWPYMIFLSPIAWILYFNFQKKYKIQKSVPI